MDQLSDKAIDTRHIALCIEDLARHSASHRLVERTIVHPPKIWKIDSGGGLDPASQWLNTAYQWMIRLNGALVSLAVPNLTSRNSQP